MAIEYTLGGDEDRWVFPAELDGLSLTDAGLLDPVGLGGLGALEVPSASQLLKRPAPSFSAKQVAFKAAPAGFKPSTAKSAGFTQPKTGSVALVANSKSGTTGPAQDAKAVVKAAEKAAQASLVDERPQEVSTGASPDKAKASSVAVKASAANAKAATELWVDQVVKTVAASTDSPKKAKVSSTKAAALLSVMPAALKAKVKEVAAGGFLGGAVGERAKAVTKQMAVNVAKAQALTDSASKEYDLETAAETKKTAGKYFAAAVLDRARLERLRLASLVKVGALVKREESKALIRESERSSAGSGPAFLAAARKANEQAKDADRVYREMMTQPLDVPGVQEAIQAAQDDGDARDEIQRRAEVRIYGDHEQETPPRAYAPHATVRGIPDGDVPFSPSRISRGALSIMLPTLAGFDDDVDEEVEAASYLTGQLGDMPDVARAVQAAALGGLPTVDSLKADALDAGKAKVSEMIPGMVSAIARESERQAFQEFLDRNPFNGRNDDSRINYHSTVLLAGDNPTITGPDAFRFEDTVVTVRGFDGAPSGDVPAVRIWIRLNNRPASGKVRVTMHPAGTGELGVATQVLAVHPENSPFERAQMGRLLATSNNRGGIANSTWVPVDVIKSPGIAEAWGISGKRAAVGIVGNTFGQSTLDPESELAKARKQVEQAQEANRQLVARCAVDPTGPDCADLRRRRGGADSAPGGADGEFPMGYVAAGAGLLVLLVGGAFYLKKRKAGGGAPSRAMVRVVPNSAVSVEGLSSKAETLRQIRKYARRAAAARVQGRMSRAIQDENFVDTLVRQAEREGWGDEAFRAETAAQQAGSRR